MNDRTAYEDIAPESAVEVLSPTTIQLLQSAEIDQQIATAKKYKRDVTGFLRDAKSLATMSEATAKACNYALPRKQDGRTVMIEGPTARLAEIIASQWGNCRYGARIVAEDERFVTAQGVFHDLEKNSFVTFELRRRITTKTGSRFGDDMIAVTANAACSIALRNAVFKGVPKAIWESIYLAARATAAGTEETLVARRKHALEEFKKLGVKPEQVYAVLEIKGHADIGLDELVTLGGLFTAINDGDTTIESVFGRTNGKTKTETKAPEKAKPETKEQATPPEDEQKPEEQPGEDPEAPFTFSDVTSAIHGAKTAEEIDELEDVIRSFENKKNQEALAAMAKNKRAQLLTDPSDPSKLKLD